jgi:hypothetical protein
MGILRRTRVTLPWLRPTGRLVTKPDLFTRIGGDGAVRRTDFNTGAWKPALVAADVIPAPSGTKPPESTGCTLCGTSTPRCSLDAGENIKALSQYLGHSDPGFTLRVYTHLMGSSESRTRTAVDTMYEGIGSVLDGPETAQGS